MYVLDRHPGITIRKPHPHVIDYLCNHTPDGTCIPRVGHVGTELLLGGIVNSLQAFTLVRARDGLSDDVLTKSIPPLPVSTSLLLVPPGVAARYERV